MKQVISIFLVVLGVIGMNGDLIHAEKIEQHKKVKQEVRMAVHDPGGS